MLYGLVFELVLGRVDAERVHGVALALLRAATPLLRLLPRRDDPVLEVEAFGRTHRSPIGVAAGLDKGATAFAGLAALGFGHVEVGTVTLDGQPGNDRPRIFRQPEERALVNRMGFPNPGAKRVSERLRRRPAGVLVGANVSKRKAATLEEAPADVAATARLLAPFADYLVVNVSSPNTPGLRDLQRLDRLSDVLEAVRVAAGDTPLLVKIAPDLADDEIDAIADLALSAGLDGIVAVNTTVHHDGPRGGLSGPPLRARSLDVLARLRARVGDELVLVSVGGVSDAHDVWDRIRAGATLVQAYTAFVYGGPSWPARVNRDLARLVREHGYARVMDAVGSGAKAVASAEN